MSGDTAVNSFLMHSSIAIIAVAFNLFMLVGALYISRKKFIPGNLWQFNLVVLVSLFINICIVGVVFYHNNHYIVRIIQTCIYILSFWNFLFWILWADALFKIVSRKYKILILTLVSAYTVLIIVKNDYFFGRLIYKYKGIFHFYSRTNFHNLVLFLFLLVMFLYPFIKVTSVIHRTKDTLLKKMFLIFVFSVVVGGMFDFIEIRITMPFMFSIGLIIAFYSMALTYFDEYNKKLYENISNQVVMKELDNALKIESDILPHYSEIATDKVRLYANLKPALSFSGDFYYFKILDNDNDILVFYMGDVSGKGIPAAIITNTVHSLLKFGFEHLRLRDNSYISKVNNYLIDTVKTMFMVTLFVGVINLKTGEVYYINAGHTIPIVYFRKTGEVSFFKMQKVEPPLGIYENYKYEWNFVKLRRTSSLFLYTDGITDIKGAAAAFNDADGLLESVRKHRNLEGYDLFEAVLRDSGLADKNVKLYDDITLMSINII